MGELRIQCSPDLVNGVQELRETFQREKFALQWHENSVRRRKRVNCQKVQRRRTIDEYIRYCGLRPHMSCENRDR